MGEARIAWLGVQRVELVDVALRAQQTIPLQRGGEPEEVVGAALYFATATSSYTTGAIRKIDGGSAYPAA